MRVVQLLAGGHGHTDAGLRAGVGVGGLALMLLAMLLAHLFGLT